MKWYKQNYVQRRDWILEHIELLNLSSSEFQLIMLIDYWNSNGEEIVQEKLCKKMGIDQSKVDKLLSLLMAKKYLKIQPSSTGAKFILDGLYETEVARVENVLNQSVHDVFESEFARPLTQQEMEQLNHWVKQENSKLVIYALKEASMYQALSFKYIDKILRAWREKGVTVEKIERGEKLED